MVVLKPSESELRFKSRSTSFTIYISLFYSSGSVFNNKIIKKGVHSWIKKFSQSRNIRNLSTFNSIPTLRRFHYQGAAIVNNQIDHKMLRWTHSVERRKHLFYLFKLIKTNYRLWILLVLFALPFIFDTMTVHLLVKIAASAMTIGKIIFHEE